MADSPETALKLVTASTKTKWRRWIAIAGLVLLLYLLSVGPAMRLVVMYPHKDERTLSNAQKVFLAAYYPLIIATLGDGAISRILGWYLRLWGLPPEEGPGDPSPNPA